MVPMLLSIGAMKAGTTWLAKQLEQNPAVATTPVKEVHYFHYKSFGTAALDRASRVGMVKNLITKTRSDDFESVRSNTRWADRYLREPIDEEWYRGLFATNSKTRYLAEFSNLNSVLDFEGWNTVRRFSPELKIIYILRNPIERMWSHVKYHLGLTGETYYTRQWTRDDFTNYISLLGPYGEYAKVIESISSFGLIHDTFVCYFDRIVDAPELFMYDIDRFLDLEPFEYNRNGLRQRFNPSEDMEMPSEFLVAASAIAMRQISQLEKLGVYVPASWYKYF